VPRAYLLFVTAVVKISPSSSNDPWKSNACVILSWCSYRTTCLAHILCARAHRNFGRGKKKTLHARLRTLCRVANENGDGGRFNNYHNGPFVCTSHKRVCVHTSVTSLAEGRACRRSGERVAVYTGGRLVKKGLRWCNVRALFAFIYFAGGSRRNDDKWTPQSICALCDGANLSFCITRKPWKPITTNISITNVWFRCTITCMVYSLDRDDIDSA
jgi:hypothetical protein